MNPTTEHSPSSAHTDEIVVGVDGSRSADAAVSYALDLARTLDAPVRLVHAVPVLGPMPPLGMVNADLMVATGRELIDDLTRRAHLAAPSVDVRSTLHLGTAVPVLVDAARRAQLVILGRSARESRLHLFGGSTAATVTARTHSPVRVVPSDWRSRAACRDVVVGLKDPVNSTALLRRAFELAAVSGGVLVMLHAWRLPAGYEPLLTETEAQRWTAETHRHILEATGAVRSGFPDVPVQVKVVQDAPTAALVEHSAGAGLVVVGRHTHTGPWHQLGSVTRVLLRSALCPVEVGPVAAEPVPDLAPDPALDLERDGAMLR